MFFLTQMKFKTDGTVDKGTSVYNTKDEAVVQFHIAIASAMQKDDTKKFTAVILDEDGTVMKREVWNAPVPPQPEPEEEPIPETYEDVVG